MPTTPGMPAVAREHEAGVALRIAGLLHLRQRLLEDPVVERLALDVEPLEPAGQLGGLDLVVGEEQTKALGRVADPADGVEAGAEDVAHVPGPDLPAAETAGLDQRPQPRPAALGQQPKTVAHENPVLADQRHHVGHGGECHEVEQVIRKVGREPQRRHQRLHQLESDPGATEHPRVGDVVIALRIHDGERGRQFGARQVVVSDHDPDARGPRGPHRFDRGDPAVAGDDERRAEALGHGEPRGPEIVSVAEPVRYEPDDVGPGLPQRPGEQGGGALAVHVVVAVDQDGASRPHRRGDFLDRLPHARDGGGIGEAGDVGPKEAPRRRFAALPPLDQQRRERRRNAAAPRRGGAPPPDRAAGS